MNCHLCCSFIHSINICLCLQWRNVMCVLSYVNATELSQEEREWFRKQSQLFTPLMMAYVGLSLCVSLMWATGYDSGPKVSPLLLVSIDRANQSWRGFKWCWKDAHMNIHTRTHTHAMHILAHTPHTCTPTYECTHTICEHRVTVPMIVPFLLLLWNQPSVWQLLCVLWQWWRYAFQQHSFCPQKLIT